MALAHRPWAWGLVLSLVVLLSAVEVGRAAPADFDRNGNQTIEREEVVEAIRGHFTGGVTRDEVIEVIRLFFTQAPVTQAGSSDATLSELSLSGIELSPGFAPSTISYTAVADRVGMTTTLIATPANAGASVTVGVQGASASNGVVEIAEGADVVMTIQVKAEDGTVTTYTVVITPPSPPYTLPIGQGWNLVSFPGTLAEPDLDDALGEEHAWVDVVLSYQEGAWVTAVRGQDGSFGGGLERMQPGNGYWLRSVRAGVLEIELLAIEEPSPSLGDYVTVTPGWNLIGVIDGDLPAYGSPHSGITFDDYLAGSAWGTAFSYATGSGWSRIVPGENSVIRSGWGYWLWLGGGVPPTRAPEPWQAQRPYSVSISQEGFDCFFDRQLALGRDSVAGCSGWDKDTIYKWEEDTLSMYIDPASGQRFAAITEEVLDYLSPILGLQFVQTANADQADVSLFVGVPKSEEWLERVSETCHHILGCAWWTPNAATSTLESGTLVIWDDYSGDDIALKAVILHEALHALTGARHSNKLTHVMWPTVDLGLPYMLPYVEDMYRLWGQSFIEPGMRASQLRSQITNTPPQRTKTDREAAVDAYMHLIRHERIDFDVDIRSNVPGCSQSSDAGQVTLSNRGEFPRWYIGAMARGGDSQAHLWAGVDGLLLSIARQDKPLADGLTRHVVGVSTSRTGVYSGYIVHYGVTVDEAGYVQSFDMDWELTTPDPDCLNDVRVTGRNFSYSAEALPPPTAEALREADGRRGGDLSGLADRLGAS